MLRFIVQKHEYDFNSCLDRREIFTILVDVPELEAMLVRGGRGEMGFESWQLLGAEVVTPNV